MKGLKIFRLTVGKKLVGLIGALLIASLASVVWLSSQLFIQDTTALIDQINSDTASNLSTRFRETLQQYAERVKILAIVLQDEKLTSKFRTSIEREFFSNEPKILAVAVQKYAPNGDLNTSHHAINSKHNIDFDLISKKTKQSKGFSAKALAKGEVQVAAIPLSEESAVIALGIPFIRTGENFSHTLLALISDEFFLESVSENSIATSFLVDREGRLLAHPQKIRVIRGESVSDLPIVARLLEGKFNNGQMKFIDPLSSEPMLGAFRLVGFAGLGVVTEIPEGKAYEAAKKVQYRSLLVAGVVIFIAFLFGYYFSGTITWPIKQLVVVSKKIASGDFDINLKPKSKDEIATLAFAFNDMAKGLEERDKVKDVFGKFHNKEIVDNLLSGEVALGGERKQAIIFFSDVRGFTAMSESMEPEDVVEMLNEYMTRMVSIIRSNHGVVDKYVGDAIMALWGVPVGGEEDAKNAIRACLSMREDLAKLNELRVSRGQHALKIGMGLNCGPVIAGNIGSDEKMEYTVIGDAVNLAARIEAMTKAYGSDLLISESLQELVKEDFILEKCSTAHVKGKSDAIQVYKVRGYYEDGQAIEVKTEYSDYTPEAADKVKLDDPQEPGQKSGNEAA